MISLSLSLSLSLLPIMFAYYEIHLNMIFMIYPQKKSMDLFHLRFQMAGGPVGQRTALPFQPLCSGSPCATCTRCLVDESVQLFNRVFTCVLPRARHGLRGGKRGGGGGEGEREREREGESTCR